MVLHLCLPSDGVWWPQLELGKVAGSVSMRIGVATPSKQINGELILQTTLLNLFYVNAYNYSFLFELMIHFTESVQ
jgi:hypothetical protein